ncbi:MAG: GNAT family N-acetyltransferase [Pseudonocardia sp.]|nr:GNAT family N-acetyltransferase [Pseudonocardia sp.]
MSEPGRCDAGNIDGLVGRRVVVRHRVGDRLTDAVGELSASGPELVVRTRRGPVRVARAAVTAVRAIPPAPPRRASLSAVARLEELCADAWPALVDERLGAWRLRAADGFTGRANTALAIGSPGMPVPAALGVVRAFAERHGIASRVQVPVGSPWDRAVASQGWELDVGHAAGALVSVQVVDLTKIPPPVGADGLPARADGHPAGADAPRTEAGAPTAAWWQLVLGGPPTPAQRHVLAGPPTGSCAETSALALVCAHRLVGAVRVASVADHLHLSVMTVDPTVRRQGHGSALLRAAAAWGRARGARWGVLQVAAHNSAALALYARSGWTEHHRYRYLVPPT